jgi:hypothetical protein
MLLPVIKRFVIVICLVTFTLFARAQQIHFVYLQTEDEQPFYVKINNKVISSSSAGYLILPKLTDGEYKFNVGFPKKEFPEENFQIVIDKKNEGFLLENFGEKGWGLFNMQSYTILMGGSTNAIASPPKNLQDDPFSKLLANVVKDSSILQKNEPVKEEPAGAAKIDTVVAVAEKKESALLSAATLLLRKKNKDGLEMIYIDRDENSNDTIRIFVPLKKILVKTSNVDTGVVQTVKPATTSLTDTTSVAVALPVAQIKSDTTGLIAPGKINTVEVKDSVAAKKNDEIKRPEINLQDPVNESVDKAATKKDDIVVLPKVVQSSTTNSDCKACASNEDFLKLRKKMASENSDDNMIKIAKKTLHSKCFSTGQIKNLSFLFLTEGGKYMFFDTAYPFTSDSDQYYTLQSQLTDSYYINRFKAMIHK